mmetsp:Transcript_51233/g.155124  ORF Transcript_51233/g.155124 Transcript_51233/m.155124 type:complete len:244 (+) Transcript_51233:83-814(+)
MPAFAAPLRLAFRQAARCPAVWNAGATRHARVAWPALGASPLAPRAARGVSTEVVKKLTKALGAELKHEGEQHEQAKEIRSFLKSTPFKLVDVPGDVNMALEREVGDKTVRIEWQLTSPFDPEAEEEGGEEVSSEPTELSVTVEGKGGAGMTFFCSTQTGEDHRYVIGMLKTFASPEEKDNVSSYNGPEFEDLDDKLQEAFDEYLAELGMGSDICDFVDAMALDKEQREYVRWLANSKKFLEA